MFSQDKSFSLVLPKNWISVRISWQCEEITKAFNLSLKRRILSVGEVTASDRVVISQ